MMGLVVGDALGVPVQFMERSEIRDREEGIVTGMGPGYCQQFCANSVLSLTALGA